MLIPPNSKLLFVGDSITDCSRARPVGEARKEGLGNGYVNIINGLISSTLPAHRIRVMNTGISGNTVRDLKARWQTDVLDLKPDWLSIKIGINDVWRNFASPLQPDLHVPLEEYQSTLETLIRITQPTLKGLILMTPYFIEANKSDPMRMMMDQYGDAVRNLASKHSAIFVDTQAALDESLKTFHPMELAADRIHPFTVGHSILARAFLKAIEYPW
jgi:lysophospholipase L1-like esterase